MKTSLSPDKWQVTVPVKIGPETQKILDEINANEEIFALWKVTNKVARVRLHMSDHGFKHFQVVCNLALVMLELLHKAGVKTNIEKDYRYTYDSAQTIVLLGALLHDIGMSVHRENHEEYSIMLGRSMLDTLLAFLPVEKRVIIRSDVLHAIISHRKSGKPMTLEAGIVRIADALDLTRQRIYSRHASIMDIHDVSSQAIDKVEVLPGTHTPIMVNIVMNHTAGLFQVDELLNKEIEGAKMDKYLDIKVFMEKRGKRQLFKQYLGKNGS